MNKGKNGSERRVDSIKSHYTYACMEFLKNKDFKHHRNIKFVFIITLTKK